MQFGVLQLILLGLVRLSLGEQEVLHIQKDEDLENSSIDVSEMESTTTLIELETGTTSVTTEQQIQTDILINGDESTEATKENSEINVSDNNAEIVVEGLDDKTHEIEQDVADQSHFEETYDENVDINEPIVEELEESTLDESNGDEPNIDQPEDSNVDEPTADEESNEENNATKSIEEKPKEIRFFDHESKKYPNTEYLEIKPLNGNNVLFSFNFEANGTTALYPQKDEVLYYNVIPKSLDAVLKSTNTRELHLRFGHGWYDSELNGKLVNNGFLSGGTGVEIWATIESTDEQGAFDEWIQLANSLSGMFCASFNFIDSSITTVPEKLFGGDINLDSQVDLKANLYHFRSALPREPICTENLTPFLKLLPTKGKQGISTLLSGNKMFNAEWTSMSIDVLTDCETGDSENCKQIIKQSINMILNVPKILEKNEMPIPKPTPGSLLRCDPSKKHDLYNCFPLPPQKDYRYSLIDLFGKTIDGGSLIASQPSRVCLDVDLENWGIEMLALTSISETYSDGKLCFDLDSSTDYNIRFNTADSSKIAPLELPPFYASRSLSGYSQDAGGFRLDFYNPGDESQKIIIFETLPWFVRVYMHSLTLTVVDEFGNSQILNVNDDKLPDYVKVILYDPAIDRIAPNHLEFLIEASAKTKLKFSFKFDKSMLLYAEYPPDANHGFELEPAIFALVDNSTNTIKYIMRTTTSLLTLPTPDFSMPYNVIILTLTIMALTFGSVFNLLVKKTITEEEAEKLQAEKPLEKIRMKIRGLLGRK